MPTSPCAPTFPANPVALRQQAAALLEQAAAIGGLKPFIAIRSHNHGESSYLARRLPTQEEVASVLDEDLEDEHLTIELAVATANLTGTVLVIPDSPEPHNCDAPASPVPGA